MYTMDMLNELRAQERLAQFETFDENDGFKLACTVKEKLDTERKSAAIMVILNDFPVFQYYMPGTGEKNHFWMGKKYHTVMKSGMSSLRCCVEQELSGVLAGEWQKDDETYAMCGGGFPICVKGWGLVGAVCVSGLPHLEDHRVLAAAMLEYAAKKV